MKLLALTLLLTSSVFAADFYTGENFNIVTSSKYKITKKFTVSVLSVQTELFESVHETAFLINGETKKIAAKLINQYDDNGTNYIYEAIIKEDILADGFSCEENEIVTYKLKFKLTGDETDLLADYTIDELALSATHSYSWDLCHDFNPKYKVIEYQKY